MNTPRLLMAAALLFWGWETGLWLWGAALAAALEASRFVRVRWELSNTDLNRIFDLCFVLLLGAALVLYSMEDRVTLIFKFAQSLPLSFFLIALAQAYGNRRTMPLSVFSWLLRRTPQSPMARKSFNISYPYFALCLLAASASTHPDRFFYIGMSLLILLALSHGRPRRISWRAWIVLAMAVLFCGQFSHQGLRELEISMEAALGTWIADLLRAQPDARECRTSIGRPGEIKLSDKIVLRVRMPPGNDPPGLLRECAYDSYKNGIWMPGSNDYGSFPVSVSARGEVRLLAPKTNSLPVEIACYLDGGKGILPLPQGVFKLEDVPPSTDLIVNTNRLGVARILNGPGLLDYRADYWPGDSIDAPPGPLDKAVPEKEAYALQAVAAELGLDGMTDEEKIHAVSKFFHKNFTYSRNSLNVPRNIQESALAQFLTITHAGHCEYFATATVLLLRTAGVNARYVTGWAVPEAAHRGDTYLVRERHAHAWALVYQSGKWTAEDNTPASWLGAADARPPWWEPVSDFMSNLYFQFSKWRWSKTSYARYVQWALAPLILYLVWRILSTRRRQKPDAAQPAAATPPWPGLDSELYMINQRLAEVHLSRLPNEPLAGWQRRLEEAFPASPALPLVFHLHRQLRFDPRGLENNDRQALRSQASQWLAEFSAATPHPPAPKGNVPG